MARKNWDLQNEFESGGKENAGEAYEEYLLLLQQRNRLLAKLKEKDEKQLELERREQGFSLYLNGANVGLRLDGNNKLNRSKTAGEAAKREVYKSDYESPYSRVKTAPSKTTRKGWNQNPPDAIKIKTDKGDKVKVDIPGVYTGKYSEDFEVYQSCIESKLDSDDGDSEDDGEERGNIRYSDTESGNSTETDEEDNHNLTFSVQDLKVLRSTLENDSSIKMSIASVTEELSNSDYEDTLSSTIFGEDEIEEELSECSINLDKMEEKKESCRTMVRSRELNIGRNINGADSQMVTKYEKSNCDNQQRELLKMSLASPKTRPISANRKQDPKKNSMLDHVMSEDISTAIAEENRRIMEYRVKRNTKSAPSTQKSAVVSNDYRPVTVSSSLTNDEIHSITEKVRSLSGRQQKNLLKMLAEIDSKDAAENWNSKKDKNRNYLELEKNNRKDSDSALLLEDSLNSSDFHSNNFEGKNSDRYFKSSTHKNLSKMQSNTLLSIQHCEEPDKEGAFESSSELIPPDNCLCIVLQLLSNWGNEKYIGLTEMQFFDETSKPVKLLPEHLKLRNSSKSEEDIKNLVNSKTKTTKEKYMWKCPYYANAKITISASLLNMDTSNLSKIVIWNYNRSLQELNIGVKDCNVLINGELKWQGVIDKGCGNQIFDYSTVIQLIPDTSKPCTGLEDETLNSSDINDVDDQINNKDLQSVDHFSTPIKYKVVNETRATHNEKPQSDFERSLAKQMKKSEQSREKVKVEEEIKPVNKRKEAPVERSSSANGGKPVWLEDSIKVKKLKDASESYLEEKKISRPISGRRSQRNTPDFFEDPIRKSGSDRSLQSTPDLIEEPFPVRRPISGRRSQQSCLSDTDDDNVKSKREMHDLFDLNSMPRRFVSEKRKEWKFSNKKDGIPSATNSLSSNSGPLLFDMPSDNNGDVKKSERTRFREMVDTNLEQSFQSINNFNVHHLGRITATIGIDDDVDDEIMSFLEPMKQKDVIDIRDSLLAAEEIIKEQEIVDTEELFELPVLPSGKDLILNIKTTWGDKHYVGLNGIEVFSKYGQLIKIRNIRANPSDINVLPEYDGDPRVVNNLIDGCYLTRDDLHLWLTPFTPGGDHFVELEFEEEVEIAMIRIWNYNKSRIHSTRGARFIEMALDGKLIFIGEIARASGILSNEDPYGDLILFTIDEDILSHVAANDFTYEVDPSDEEDYLASSMNLAHRPQTADKAEESAERPFTCPKSRQHSAESVKVLPTPKEDRILSSDDGFMHCGDRILSSDDGFVHCRVITIFFCETWEDQHYLGLTGLEVLGETFEKIPLEMRMLEASPQDLNDLEEYDDDDRTLDKLINGINVTTSDENMWLIPFDQDGSHQLKIIFDDVTIVTGLRIWNYNKSLEDTFRGVKTIHVYCDDHFISPETGFLLRKGPGHCHFDFAQDILFNDPSLLNESEYPESSRDRKINLQKIVNEYETIMMPSGFVFQFKLFSCWGDPYYIGLNGIEVYDKVGEKINLTDNNITAYPHSVNILDGIDDDLRTPDKLVDGVYDTYDGRHMWLAPILPEQVNIVYIVFDKPVAISMIKMWNYSKTPGRGVRNFGLLVDDLLVYSGILPQCTLYQRAIVPGIQLPIAHHTILFTDNEKIAMKERKHVLSSSISYAEQNIQLTNDRAVLNPHKDNERKSAADPSMRPMTSVTSVGKFRTQKR